MVTSGEEGEGNAEMGEWEVQSTGCKIGCRDVLYNTGKIANTL